MMKWYNNNNNGGKHTGELKEAAMKWGCQLEG